MIQFPVTELGKAEEDTLSTSTLAPNMGDLAGVSGSFLQPDSKHGCWIHSESDPTDRRSVSILPSYSVLLLFQINEYIFLKRQMGFGVVT